jgi:hypothetical protein
LDKSYDEYLQIAKMRSNDIFDVDTIISYLRDPYLFDHIDPPPTKMQLTAMNIIADYIDNNKDESQIADAWVFKKIKSFKIDIGAMPYMMIENNVPDKQHERGYSLRCVVNRMYVTVVAKHETKRHIKS